ncbi:MAG: hypothetical protein GTO54_11740 [Nitrososphaeria archaeon]|nr:hypothetical protein [Nitrososphaeria archaeon]
MSFEIRRTGGILKNGASDQISDYQDRFTKLQGLYDEFLSSLMVSDFDYGKAYDTALEFFGSDAVNFAAIDGTEYSRPVFDLVVFFGGAYTSTGTIHFRPDTEPKVEYVDEHLERGKGISSCVPIYINEVPEIDQVFLDEGQVSVFKPLDDQAIINNSKIANWIMAFSEMYLAYKLALDSRENIKILLMDRSLSGEVSSLMYDTSKRKFWKTNSALFGLEIDGLPIDMNDLAYGRHGIANPTLNLPPPRGDYLRYSIIHTLERGELTLDEICQELGAEDEKRRKRVERFVNKSMKEGYILKDEGLYKANPRYLSTWNRLKKAVTLIGDQLFSAQKIQKNPMRMKKGERYEWLTTLDMAFLTLFTIYMLIEECWKRKILILGITKDTAARDFKRHVIPICSNEGLFKISQEKFMDLPNTDRMLLQSASLLDFEKVPVPWSLVEYDTAFKTMVPDLKKREGYVSGAVKNRVIAEKLFLKSYVQLSQASHNPKLRSNVLFMDRLVYPEFDLRGENELEFLQEYGGAIETVRPLMYKDRSMENPVQNLVMVVLNFMTSSSIPEAFGHNKPLFISDKVAKWHHYTFRKIVDSTTRWILNNHKLRDFVFYMSTFRERRRQIESLRGEF